MANGLWEACKADTSEQAEFCNKLIRVCIDCYSYAKLYRLARDFKKNGEDEWFIFTKSAYYDEAIMNWWLAFGLYAEETHYYGLLDKNFNLDLIESSIKDTESLKEYLLKEAKVDKKDFEKYHSDVRDYRNNYLIHRSYDSEKLREIRKSYPILDIPLATAFCLIQLLNKIFKNFPSISFEEKSPLCIQYLNLNHQDILDNHLNKIVPDCLK